MIHDNEHALVWSSLDDAGEAAAQVCFKTGLGELAGTFLGPGDWTPDPLAIAECWDRVGEINPDEE